MKQSSRRFAPPASLTFFSFSLFSLSFSRLEASSLMYSSSSTTSTSADSVRVFIPTEEASAVASWMAHLGCCSFCGGVGGKRLERFREGEGDVGL